MHRGSSRQYALHRLNAGAADWAAAGGSAGGGQGAESMWAVVGVGSAVARIAAVVGSLMQMAYRDSRHTLSLFSYSASWPRDAHRTDTT